MGGERAADRFGNEGPQLERAGLRAHTLAAVALLAAACAGGGSRNVQPQPGTSDRDLATVQLEAEQHVLSVANRERRVAGLPPLSWNRRLAVDARAHSIEMRETRDVARVLDRRGATDRTLIARIGNTVVLQGVVLARNLDDVYHGVLSSPDGHESLMSDVASSTGIGISFGGQRSGRREVFITVIVRTQSSEDSEASAGSRMVPPTVIEGRRISGTAAIAPDDVTKTLIMEARKTKLVGSYKLCLSAQGEVVDVAILKPTGFWAYDAKIVREMRTWRYRPYEVNGKPAPVCTAVTFIYRQR